MLEIKGIFKCKEIKVIDNNFKILVLINSEKDQNGKYNNTYYTIAVNEKVSKLVKPEVKREMTKCLLSIEGWLKVSKKDSYTNLIIYPNKIEKWKKMI